MEIIEAREDTESLYTEYAEWYIDYKKLIIMEKADDKMVKRH